MALPHLSGLKLQGEDALAFAHAQFTTAFDADRGPGWALTAWCNPKGKVISVMLARSCTAEVDLVVPETQVESLAARLPMYAIGRKVKVLAGLAVAGSLQPVDEARCVLGPDPRRGIDLVAHALPADPVFINHWKNLDIRAGIAWLSPESSELFLPQALGLEEREGLSYRKGCYPGQEVIARVHYLGKAKQHLLGFRLSGHFQGHEWDLDDDSGRRMGRALTCSAFHADTIGLAVVGTEWAPGQTVVCGENRGRLSEPAALC